MLEKEKVGSRLSQLRKEHGIKRSHMANTLGLSRSMITMYESGKRLPSYEILVKLANMYEVSTDWILGRTDSRYIAASKEQMPLVRHYFYLFVLDLKTLIKPAFLLLSRVFNFAATRLLFTLILCSMFVQMFVQTPTKKISPGTPLVHPGPCLYLYVMINLALIAGFLHSLQLADTLQFLYATCRALPPGLSLADSLHRGHALFLPTPGPELSPR